MLVFEVIEIETVISFIDLDEFADTIIKLMGVFCCFRRGCSAEASCQSLLCRECSQSHEVKRHLASRIIIQPEANWPSCRALIR